MEAPPRPLAAAAGGPLGHRMVFPLKGAAPGEYVLVLTVTDPVSGQKLERREAFVVEPAA